MAGETNDEGVVGALTGFSTTVDLLVLLGLVAVEREFLLREPLREPSTLRLGVTGWEERGVLDAVGVCDRDDPPVAIGTCWCEFGGWAGAVLEEVADGLCWSMYACTRAITVSANGLRKLRAN